MQKTKIEWCDYTWNPVVGCKHNCWYCYAKRLNDRFKFISKWDNPKFFPERLEEPYKIKEPSTIFVCSMSDLFGWWQENEVIEQIIRVAEINKKHTFMFLTKNGSRLSGYEFPKNCWLGITITGLEYNLSDLPTNFRIKNPLNKKFISFEPLLADVSNLDLKGIDLVIVGAMTGRGAVKPKKEWISGIKHSNIFYKNNIKNIL